MKKDILVAGLLSVAVAGVFGGSMFAAHKEVTRIKNISEIAIPAVPAGVTASRANGVITADEWAAHYPAIYASHVANSNNKGTNGIRAKYPEDNPDIQILYQGMAFSFDYTEAIGHSYTLDDIGETTRPHKLANCLTCKTPDFTALVNAMGTEAYSYEFDTVYPDMSETVSCYTCHGNTPGTIVIEHDYMHEAFQDEIDAGKADPVNVSCAQCHIEYYFDPTDNKATSVPYDSPDNFDPDSILAFYNEIGFVDYTNENTGVGMIKVQHPEFETFTGKGSVHKGSFNCADCHMGVAYDQKGNAYVSHEFTSPLNNEQLLKDTCSKCHNDLAKEVAAIQEQITGREQEISGLLVELNQKLADAVAKGSKSEAELDELRKLDRDAQFYWDFVYVENSEGAHNSKLDNECLDKAEALAKQALEKL